MRRALSILKHLLLALAGLFALVFPLLPRAAHSEPLAGPVAAHVVRVIDGDTVEVAARVWIDQVLTINVRLAHIDAPEIGSHARCTSERDKADTAKAYLASLIEGREVQLADIDTDKYGGRVDARIVLSDGRDVSDLMLKKRLAIAYEGGHKTPWCAAAGD